MSQQRKQINIHFYSRIHTLHAPKAANNVKIQKNAVKLWSKNKYSILTSLKSIQHIAAQQLKSKINVYRKSKSRKTSIITAKKKNHLTTL